MFLRQPYALIDDGILLQQDGSLVAGWSYQGPDMMSAAAAEMDALSARLNHVLRLGTGWMVQCDAIRSRAPGYPEHGAFPDSISKLIDDERRQRQPTAPQLGRERDRLLDGLAPG